MLEITEKEFPNVIIVSVIGDLIFNEARGAEEYFIDVIKRSPRVIGVDCRRLKNLDSSGLGVFIKLFKDAKNAGISAYFLDISSQISTLFDVSKLDNFFDTMSNDEFCKQYLQNS